MSQELWHILIIDDSADDRADLRHMLLQDTRRRYRFSEAARGDEGVRMALDPASRRIDCVLLDYHLPDMDAPEVLAAVCAGAAIAPWPVVVITGSAADLGPALLRAGAQDYLGKRWTNAESLMRAVANSIERFGLLVERQRVAAALRQSEERYRGLFEAMDEGFCIVEPIFDADARAVDCRLVQVNPSFARQTGLADARGRTAGELAPGLEAFWLEAYGAVAKAGAPVRLEGHAASLQRWFDVYAFALSAPQQHQVAMLFTDITERKRVAAALLAATVAADNANRAKSEFLFRMSHELRSPLSAILGFAQLIDAGVPAPTAAQKASTTQILQAGWYLLSLINEILDLSLIESGKMALSPEAVSLAEVLGDCQTMLQPQARQRGIEMDFPRFEQPCFLQADRTRIRQVLINLLSNAVKYNVEGGTIKVRCRLTQTRDVRISVQDSGPGLSAAQLAQLFQPFNRLGQETGVAQGTGIGLVVSKRLVELMGGTIGAASTVGVGSRFWFELPAATEPEPGAATPHRPASLRTNGNAPLRSVLCVEASSACGLLLEGVIARRPGLCLLHADTVRHGVGIARQVRPDVILMGVDRAGLSGAQALAMLAEDTGTAHIPVIALSEHAGPQDIEAGLAAGFFRYLTQPILADEFMLALDLALAHTANPSARVAVEETP